MSTTWQDRPINNLDTLFVNIESRLSTNTRHESIFNKYGVKCSLCQIVTIFYYGESVYHAKSRQDTLFIDNESKQPYKSERKRKQTY